MNKKAISFLLLVVVVIFFIITFVVPRVRSHISASSLPSTSIQTAQHLTILTPTGTTTLSLLIADTPATQTKGLGDRQSLPADQGMLFVFPHPDFHLIWMKDMLFPIDIIWLDSNLRIINIVEHATPASYPTIFSAKEKDSFVLEVNDGYVAQHGIKKGTIFTRI